MLNFRDITATYYTKWLDCSDMELMDGVHYVRTQKRDERQPFYPARYSLYVCKTESALVVSYSSRIQERIDQMKRDIQSTQMHTLNLDRYLSRLLGAPIGHSLKFVFDSMKSSSSENVIALKKADYALFLGFTMGIGGSEWKGMREYFEKICGLGYCFAKIVDNKAVSVSDAPGMPFMGDAVQEIGVNTLPDYRGRNYAKDVGSACVGRVISDAKVPVTSCASNNRAAERLSYAMGFKKFCEVFTAF